MTPLCPQSQLHWFSAFFPPKTEGKLKRVIPSILARIGRHISGLFSSDLWSSSFHTSSMGFKSADCAGQDISWKTFCSSLLLMYLWQCLLVYFESLSCINTNLWTTSYVPDASVCCDSQSNSICPITGTSPGLCNCQNSHTIAKPPPYFTVGYIQGVRALSPTLRAHRTSYLTEIFFFNPKNFIPLPYCPVFMHLGPLEPLDIVLLPQ